MNQTIRVRGSRNAVRNRILQLPSIMAGKTNRYQSEAREMQLAMATKTMEIVKREFMVKAHGGTDGAGLSWPPLAEYTIAKRLDQERVEKLKAKMKRTRTDKFYKKARLAYERSGYQLYLASNGSIPILIDSADMYESLSPGFAGRKNPHGVIRYEAGAIIFGTNMKRAWEHHQDGPRKTKKDGTPLLPQRRLWAKPAEWPREWLREIRDAGRDASVALVKRMLGA